MRGLDLKIHAANNISIKDTTHSIDISEFKWDPLFKFLFDLTDSVYFYGVRVLVVNDELEKNIDFAAEEVFINKDYNKILFRIKNINLLSRGLLMKIWSYYDPLLVFLMDKNDEDIFLEANYKNKGPVISLTHIEGYFIVYPGMEEDVLWVNSDLNFSTIPCLV
ncbi:MAG: hypothetical protein WC623_07345 [Pedobacter sp.]|uniref:hypothetical protein n=1 Tax=Pedobacter sp. TaxID=1411316 RepID=UPI00356B2502